ncbi:MAG: precorrin-8X methylmutase [Clostridiales bacterium]|nr:precorrin-8X methylmutase [Clostridiales bacterium]
MVNQESFSRNIEYEHVLPAEIEKRSFEIISEELARRGVCLDPELAPVIKRVIHTTADFDYAGSLCFSPDALGRARRAIANGACIVTDTHMAQAGINKRALAKFGGEVYNFIADEDVAALAHERGTTRSAVCMDKAAALRKPLIFAIGNAPTALIRLCELIREGRIRPELIIGVPVGFVNVVYAKELVMETEIPYIVARGRKGGSNVASAICNAILYTME